MIVDLGTMGIEPILNGYLIISEGEAAIVETGPSSVIDEYIKRASKHVDPSRISYALVSHIHVDHSGGAWKLADKLPNVKIVVYEKGARHLIDPSKLIDASAKTLGGIYAVWGEVRPVSADRVMAVNDGSAIKIGNYELELVAAPGHASHSSAWYLKNEKVLFPGDSMGMLFNYSIWPAAPPPFNMAMFEQSVKRLSQLNPERICFPHFGCTDSGIFDSVVSAYREINEIVKVHCKASDDQILHDILSIDKFRNMPKSDYFRDFLEMNLRGLPDYHA
ncbi:MAG: MBL fold metallo-hydrolase [Thaumarchaeota archaeon]|jgi:glyoxylase-like metal-dependent hydrolase (beta-lactamase superfamily II)|nr:MBL fold metallo-hydrolase [Nitrososphaerota archaeon]